ncbi:MAG: HAD family hydrolase [Candidatus Dormibacteria bacterium]
MKNDAAPLAVAFDVDETLVSTGGAGAKSWRRGFEKLWSVDADISKFTHGGMTDPEVGRLTFKGVMKREPKPKELAQLMHSYLQFLPEEVANSKGYHVLPGAEDLLLRMIEAGILVGITSGAVEAATHIKLARAGLNQYFSFGGFGSDSTDRGELTRTAIRRASVVMGSPVDPARVCVVGDTPMDIDAAHAAGAIGIGVATGKFDTGQLKQAGADHVLKSLTDPFPGLVPAASARSGSSPAGPTRRSR